MLIEAITYNQFTAEGKEIKAISDLPAVSEDNILWVHVTNLKNEALVNDICSALAIHPLVVEDIFNTEQRPKFVDYEDYIFTILKKVTHNKGEIETTQISLILGQNFVLSFQNSPNDVFRGIKEQIKKTKQHKLQKHGADFLWHNLLDTIVDSYFPELESVAEHIEELEDEILQKTTPEEITKLHLMKKNINYIRKSISPLKEIISSLDRSETELLTPNLDVYLRDVYDHVVHITDNIEIHKESISGLMEIYLTTTSNKMNQVMKVLAIISTIFMPLTFIAGIYGMNFEHMPELKWEYGYFEVLGLMFLISVGLLGFFFKKKWL